MNKNIINTRKTTWEYKKEYYNLLNSLESIKLHVLNRLIFLCNKYPEAPVARKKGFTDEIIIKAKSINNKVYLEGYDIDVYFEYVDSIEKYINSIENVRQLKIDF